MAIKFKNNFFVLWKIRYHTLSHSQSCFSGHPTAPFYPPSLGLGSPRISALFYLTPED